MIKDDIYYMKKALIEAKKCIKEDEVPIGAIIIDENGKILAKAHNKREGLFDPTAHAEILAIKKASKKRKDWRIINTTLYVTLEPCVMCAGAIMWARIKRVVFGAYDEKGGALVSSFKIFENKDINHHPEITGGVLKDECSSILKEYFKQKRK